MENYLKKLEVELKLRGFSERTVDTYIRNTDLFFRTIKKDPQQILAEDIKEYFSYLISYKQLIPRSLLVRKASLKFFFEEIMKKNIVNLKTPKIPKSVPIYLTKQELKKLFDTASTKKSLLIMKLLYSTGLRISEGVNLKISDFEFENNMGWVRSGKGNKDRAFFISPKLVEEIKKHIQTLDEKEIYLFPGKKRTFDYKKYTENNKRYSN